MRLTALTPQTPTCTTAHTPVTLHWSDGSTTALTSPAILALRLGMTRAQSIAAIRSHLARKPSVAHPCESAADGGWGCMSAPLYPGAPMTRRRPDRVCAEGTDWGRELARRNGTGTRWVVRVCVAP